MHAKILGTIILFALLLAGLLFAQPEVLDRKAEKAEYASLQYAEKILEEDIQDAYKILSVFGYLVPLAKQDRLTAITAEKEPLNIRHNKRALKYVPWRTVVRYIKEGDLFILNAFGELEEVNALIQEEITKARENDIQVENFQIGSRDGVELNQFGFIYAKDPDKTRAIGSRRKSIRLFFRPAGLDEKGQPAYQLELATIRVIHHNFRKITKETDLIIDPSPIDDNMEDIILLHRKNKAPVEVSMVGLMHNTGAYDNRNNLKRRYRSHLREHFIQTFQLVAKYNNFNVHERHKKQIERIHRGLEY